MIAATSILEATMVLSRIDPEPELVIDSYMRTAKIVVHPLGSEEVRTAQAAFLRYGKGRHPARLNFGDCFSYAVAKVLDAPLLYVGNDFSQTDIRSA